MADRTESPTVTPTNTSTGDLADLLRLHFEASRSELTEHLEQWAKKAMGNAVTVAITLTLAGIGGLFMLVAAVLAIGDALGHRGWGLLIVGGALGLAGAAFALSRDLIGKNRASRGSE